MSHAMSFVTMNLVTMMYLIASVCFIQALKGLSSPSTARRGNAFGMSGMAIAAVTTVALILKLIIDKDDQLLIDREDEIIKASLVCAGSEILRK